MKTELFNIFNPTQIEILKEAVKYGIWGDTTHEFGNKGQVSASGIGCCTNEIKRGGKYKGKQLSGFISTIKKVIKQNDLTFISSASDWWGDGSGDMIFFNIDELDTDWSELSKWARS